MIDRTILAGQQRASASVLFLSVLTCLIGAVGCGGSEPATPDVVARVPDDSAADVDGGSDNAARGDTEPELGDVAVADTEGDDAVDAPLPADGMDAKQPLDAADDAEVLSSDAPLPSDVVPSLDADGSTAPLDAPSPSDASPLSCVAKLIAPLDSGGSGAPAMAYDPAGALHVVYIDGTEHFLRHARRAEQGLSKETVDGTIDGTDLVGASPQMAIDAAGRIHVAYAVTNHKVPSSFAAVQYTVHDTTGWSKPNTAGNAAGRFALAVGSGGSPSIAFTNLSSGVPVADQVFVARLGATGWQSAPVATVPASKTSSHEVLAAAADASGNPWIAFDDGGMVSVIQPATGGDFVVGKTLLSHGGRAVRLAVDSAGTTGTLLNRQSVAIGAGSFWTIEDVATSAATDSFLSLDAAGTPQVGSVYLVPGSQGTRRYQTRTLRRPASGWTIESTYVYDSSTADFITPLVMALDTQSRPVLSLDSFGYKLITVEMRETTPVVTPIEVKLPVSLAAGAVDSGGHLSVVYLEGTQVRMVTDKADGTWDRSVPSPPIQSPNTLASAADGSFKLSGTKNGAVALATLAAGVWTSEQVALSEGSTGHVTVATAKDGSAHLFWGDGNPFTLRHARQVGGTWTVTTVGPMYSATVFPVLAMVDPDGVPYVAYEGAVDGLRFGRWTGTTWQLTAIAGPASHGAALTRDQSGRACLTHYQGRPLQLVSSCLAGNVFEDRVVDPAPKELSILDGGNDALGTLHLLTGSYTGAGAPDTLRSLWTIGATAIQHSLPLDAGQHLAVTPAGTVRLLSAERMTGRLFAVTCQ